MKISASFLTSANMVRDLQKLNLTDVDYIHVDYMDGKFVSNKSLSFRQLKKVYKYTSKRLDVHLMMVKPEKMICKFAMLNTEFITVHAELEGDKILHYLDLIHSYGIKAGLCLKPNTDIHILEPFLEDVDLILVMGVEPGRGGQPFILETIDRISNLKNFLQEAGRSDILISVDGGITKEVREKLTDIDILVSGNYITGSKNFQERIDSLR